MKRRLILSTILVFLLLLGSCSGLYGTGNTEEKKTEPHPGTVISYSSSSDCRLWMLGYPLNTQEAPQPKALSSYYKTDDEVAEKKTIEFNGESYAADYVCSRNLKYRKICYDCYRCEKDDQSEFVYRFLLDRETGRMIGYEKIYIGTLPSSNTQMSDEELTAKAVEELAKYTDINYYTKNRVDRITNAESGQIIVWFYNQKGDVEFADSSWVRFTKDGRIKDVKAFPEPDTINACNFNELNVEEFDAKVEEQIKKEYRDYHVDDETKLLDVRYTGMKVKHRCITSDDDGKPVIAYYVTPQLEYDLTWKDEAAKIMTDKGAEAHEEGVDEPPVYLMVYIGE